MIELGQKTCEGCDVSVTRRAVDIGGHQCAFVDFGFIEICPCVNCLVKMVCRQPCADRIRARNVIMIIDQLIR